MSDWWEGSWLQSLTNGLGSLFGSSTPTNVGPVANGNDYGNMLNSLSGGGGGGTSLWPSIITAGSGLINSFFTQSQNSDLATQYAQQQKAALEAQLAAAAKAQETQKEIAAMYSGATVKAAAIAAGAAKKNTLAGLYNNWANATERGGEATGQEAQNIGAMVGRSLDARQASLK